MNMLLRAGIAASALVVLIATAGCPSNPSTPNDPSRPSGTLYMNGDVKANTYSLDLATGTTTNLFAGIDPYRTPEGTFIVRTNFGLEEVSGNGVSSRMIVKRENADATDITYNNEFHNPQLSRDGKYIAYEGQFGYIYDVYVVDRYTGELLLTMKIDEIGQGYTRPSWTPDNRIVVAGRSTSPGIFITDNEWSTLTRIDENITFPDQPQVSPDGKTIALIVNKHVYTMNIDGTGLKQVTTSASEEEMPSWSPDGKHIAIYAYNSILLLNVAASTAFDVRSISPAIDNFMALTSSRGGQFFWRQ